MSLLALKCCSQKELMFGGRCASKDESEQPPSLAAETPIPQEAMADLLPLLGNTAPPALSSDSITGQHRTHVPSPVPAPGCVLSRGLETSPPPLYRAPCEGGKCESKARPKKSFELLSITVTPWQRGTSKPQMKLQRALDFSSVFT